MVSAVYSNVNFLVANNIELWYSSPTYHSRSTSRRAQTPSPLMPSEPVEQSIKWSRGNRHSKMHPLTNKQESKRDTSSCVFAEHIVSKEQPTNAKTTHVVPRTCEELLVPDAVTGIPVHFEEVLNNMALETLTKSQKCVDNRVPTALKALVLHTVRKVVTSPEQIFGRRHSQPRIHHPDSSTSQIRTTDTCGQASKVESRIQQFVEAVINVDHALSR